VCSVRRGTPMKMHLPFSPETTRSVVQYSRSPPIIDSIEGGHQPLRLATVLIVEEIGLCRREVWRSKCFCYTRLCFHNPEASERCWPTNRAERAGVAARARWVMIDSSTTPPRQKPESGNRLVRSVARTRSVCHPLATDHLPLARRLRSCLPATDLQP